MKKVILISFLLISSTAAVFAQLPSFTLGIKGGVNYSTLKTTDDLTDQNSIMGYQVGAFARVGGAGLYFQPEVYFGSKGNDFVQVQSSSGTTVAAKGKVRFTTLDVPLLLGTKVGPNKLNVHFMAGPVISFIIDKNTTFDSAYTSITDFSNYKNQTIGLQGGAGVDLGSLSVDLRYEAGLSNVSESSKYDQKQNLWHLSLGFKIL